jgi:hypothetical protein
VNEEWPLWVDSGHWSGGSQETSRFTPRDEGHLPPSALPTDGHGPWRSHERSMQRRSGAMTWRRPRLTDGGRDGSCERVSVSSRTGINGRVGLGQAGVAEACATGFRGLQSGFGALADDLPLAFRQGGVKVQHEWLDIGAELGHEERHAMRHQPADEMHVPAQPIELRHCHRAPAVTAGLGQGGGELRAPLEGVSALAGLDLEELGNRILETEPALPLGGR